MIATEELILQTADRLFAAITNGDIAAVAALWSDDIGVWRTGGGRERDKSSALKVIEWFVGATTERRYEVLDRHVFGAGFVQQHVLHATANSGEQVALRVCLVVKVADDGSIRHIDEYLDPAELAPLLR